MNQCLVAAGVPAEKVNASNSTCLAGSIFKLAMPDFTVHQSRVRKALDSDYSSLLSSDVVWVSYWQDGY